MPDWLMNLLTAPMRSPSPAPLAAGNPASDAVNDLLNTPV